MTGKLLSALGLATAMAGSLAAGDCGIKSGAYAGVSLGVSHLGGKSDYKFTSTVPAFAGAGTTHLIKSNLSTNSFAAGVFAGYGFKLSRLWLAGEVGYRFANLKSKGKISNISRDGFYNLTCKASGSFNVVAHLGALVNDKAVLYAIVGVEVRRFKVGFFDQAGNDFGNKLNKGYRGVSFAPGIGARFAISKNLALRTEYVCALGGKKTLTSAPAAAGALFGGVGVVTLRAKSRPRVHSASIGLLYAF